MANDLPSEVTVTGGAAPPERTASGHAAKGPLNDFAKDAVARAAVLGHSMVAIGHMVDRPPETIRRMLDGSLADHVERARAQLFRFTVSHQFEMIEMLEDARAGIRQGLCSADERLKLDTSKWLIENLVPKPTTKVEVDAHHSGSVGHDMTPLMEGIGASLAAIAAAREGKPDPLARVRPGSQAVTRVTPTPTEPPKANGSDAA